MLTYQDLLNLGEEPTTDVLLDFMLNVINQHKASDIYKTAVIAEEYDRHKNVTINEYQKLLYTVTGEAIPDNYSANFKLASRFYHRFVTQQNQFLLGNGIQWENESTKDALGGDFDIQVQKGGHKAISHGLSFGFWNLDHVDVFSVLEFAPLWDEETSALKAGVRFWQIDSSKPLRATLFEMDGYTEMIWRKNEDGKYGGEILHEKRPYIIHVKETDVGDEEIFDWENYPSFPVVPFWGNEQHQSEIIGIREQIDAYDLIKSGFCNTVDEASIVYWTIQNAGGMDDVDLSKFVERMKRVHAAQIEDDGAKAEPTSIDAPHESREALLDRLRKDLYEDYMALDTKEIANGAATATQIRAAYEPLNSKADDYEYCVIQFIEGILSLAGIEDEPTFTRSTMINASEEIQNVLQAATYLSDDYVTEKILSILGDGDKAKKMLKQIDADDIARLKDYDKQSDEEFDEETEEEDETGEEEEE